MSGTWIVYVAVCLHNLAAPAALAAQGGLTPAGRRRAALAFAAAQAMLGVIGLLLGQHLQPRLGGFGVRWGAITLLMGAALWDLFQPAVYAAVNLPVADNPEFTGPVAADGAAFPARLWLCAGFLSLDNVAVGAGLGVGGAAVWPGAIALIAAALSVAPAGLVERELGELGIRLPRLGSYLLLATTAALSVGLLAL